MRKILFGTLIALSLALTAFAQQQSTTRFYTPFDDEVITVAGTSVGFTSSKITPAGQAYRAERVSCVVVCSTTSPCPVQVRETGSAATTTTGQRINSGDILKVYGYNAITKTRFIRQSSNSADLQCSYAF